MKSRLLSSVVGLSMLALAATGCGTMGGAAVGAARGRPSGPALAMAPARAR